ncbi:MAG TPA: nitrilase-related carbon-nitrogen hydrolase, partial [Actinomycetota bacterium]|nr:nitrilase-related carbon-nitrogen hydrolase [Actinomycetota bacterium]
VFARKGSEVVVYTTNDSSFERSFASEQHLAHARVRALEMRQWGVQAALSGISAVIGPDGSVTGRTRLFEPDVVRAELRARPAASLYSRTGDVFAAAWAAAAAAAVALALAVRAPRRRRSESQPDEPVTGLSPTLR